MSENSDSQRKSALANHVTPEISKGWHVESQGDFQVVMSRGKKPNHLLHIILSIFTGGIWLVVYLFMIIRGGEKRQMLVVDEFGTVTKQSL